jgi:protease-4
LAAAIGLLLWVTSPDLNLLARSNRIGVIQVRGMISDPREVLKAIKEYRKSSYIQAILVRIDSPGGGVGASQEIYRELRRTVGEKPVVASMGGVAASGGYYIASACTRIIANPGTITGSIGVISYFPHMEELFRKIGYDMLVVKSGRFKDVGNPAREMTQEERELLQGTIEETHRQFVRDVAAGRSLPEEKVQEIADGRILTGQKAFELGLLDELGNFEDGVAAAARLGKIEGEPKLVYHQRERRSLLDFLLGNEVSDQIAGHMDGTVNFLRYQMPVVP